MDSKPVWMKAIAEEYPEFAEKSLAEISIPGSHDSAAYNISGCSPLAPDCQSWARNLAAVVGHSAVQTHHAPWSKCQNYDIFTQLLNGIRYLDLRVCYVNDQLWFCHAQISVLVTDVLTQIAQFVGEVGVDEILLLDFNHFYQMDRNSHAMLCGMIMSTLSEWICPATERTCRATLSELWKTPQRIIVLYNNPVEVATHQWLWHHSDHISTPWHNTTENETLLQRMTEQWKQWASETEFKKFTITQSQRTPNLTTVSSSLLKFHAATPPVKSVEELAVGTHLLVCDWLEDRRKSVEATQTGVNIAIADFIDLYDGKWIDSVISLNIPRPAT